MIWSSLKELLNSKQDVRQVPANLYDEEQHRCLHKITRLFQVIPPIGSLAVVTIFVRPLPTTGHSKDEGGLTHCSVQVN